MTNPNTRLYAIVLRLAAMRPGAIPADHGDQARATLLNLIQRGDSPLAQKLHDENAHKPYTISLLQGGRRGADRAQHFGEGDAAEWRFTLLCEPAFEAVLRRYLLDRALPHVRVGAVQFAVSDVFASGASHPDSGHISVSELTARWTQPPDTLPRRFTLDFRSPTAFSFGYDRARQQYRYQAMPEPGALFSSLRKRWAALGGAEPGDNFDEWVRATVRCEPLDLRIRPIHIERRSVTAFSGQVRFWHQGDTRWLSFLHLLADLTFWTGAGYQPTRGLGQVRRIDLNEIG
jgi:CRISPR-associated endoribonuclease Cas6